MNNEEVRGIKLRNIDLTGISKLDQFEKVNEEKQELIEAVKEYLFRETQENKNNAISEYFDLIQSALGLLDKFGISAEEVQKEYPKHLEKIKNRPRIKECKKCINCSLTSFGGKKVHQCDKNDELIYSDDYAKSCKYYEEKISATKKCVKCLNKADCRLYLSEHFQGQQEAERCQTYSEKE